MTGAYSRRWRRYRARLSCPMRCASSPTKTRRCRSRKARPFRNLTSWPAWLKRPTRTGPEIWHQEEIEEVRFVPLIGEQGWAEEEMREAPAQGPPAGVPQLIRAAAQTLPEFDDPDFAATFDRYGDRKVVLLGEASHGTSEFYRARAAITRRLIERHGFSFVAVE